MPAAARHVRSQLKLLTAMRALFLLPLLSLTTAAVAPRPAPLPTLQPEVQALATTAEPPSGPCWKYVCEGGTCYWIYLCGAN